MPWIPFTVLAASVLLVGFALSRYNGLVRARKRVQEAWSGIDVQLRRRASLLPNLIEGVKAYAAHERDVFEEVAHARSAFQNATGTSQKSDANDMISAALGRLFAVVESYPQLRASENFMSLRADLSDIEEKIAFARQFYNRTVLDYNTRLETFPDALIAGSLDFKPAEFFQAGPEDRTDIRMKLAEPQRAPEAPPAG
jgi:LemA protein